MIPASKIPEAAALRDIEVRPIQWQHPGIRPRYWGCTCQLYLAGDAGICLLYLHGGMGHALEGTSIPWWVNIHPGTS